jgi:hypothetical protein
MRESCTSGSVKGASSDRRLHATLPFNKFLRLGGGTEEISQICVVWGKAVAVSRLELLTVWFDPRAPNLMRRNSRIIRKPRRPTRRPQEESVELGFCCQCRESLPHLPSRWLRC